jgi:hypothetical protein
VGSAAFNLLFITAVTVMAPAPRIAKVHQYNVYLTTSFFAVEAYIWLLFIVEFNTPERIDLWEVRLTPPPAPPTCYTPSHLASSDAFLLHSISNDLSVRSSCP